jgi:hypothetical protein
VDKAGACPCVAPSRRFPLGQAPGLTRKYKTRMVSPAADKYYNLLLTIVNYRRKKFI